VRIAVNASIVDRFLTGLGVYTVNMVRELARLHGDLTVYTAHPEREEFGSVTARRIWRAVEPSRGRRGHLARLVWLQLVLPVRLLADRASILFSPLPEGSLFSPVPQVVVVHDLIPLHFPRAFPRQSVYFRYVIPLLLRRSRVILSDSASTREDLGRFYRLDKRRIHVVPVGYDVRRFHPEVDPEPLRRRLGLGRYILYVGNLLPHKNLARLIAAFSRLEGVQGRPFQSVARAGGSPSFPSHHGTPSSVTATFVKIVLRRMHSIAFGLVRVDVPGTTPKNPASGLMA